MSDQPPSPIVSGELDVPRITTEVLRTITEVPTAAEQPQTVTTVPRTTAAAAAAAAAAEEPPSMEHLLDWSTPLLRLAGRTPNPPPTTKTRRKSIKSQRSDNRAEAVRKSRIMTDRKKEREQEMRRRMKRLRKPSPESSTKTRRESINADRSAKRRETIRKQREKNTIRVDHQAAIDRITADREHRDRQTAIRDAEYEVRHRDQKRLDEAWRDGTHARIHRAAELEVKPERKTLSKAAATKLADQVREYRDDGFSQFGQGRL